MSVYFKSQSKMIFTRHVYGEIYVGGLDLDQSAFVGMDMASSTIQVRPAQASSLRRVMLLCAGHVLFGIGFAGMFLPVLPTTVFWIGAAMCYAKSSPERFEKLVNRADKGQVLVEYMEHGVIAPAAKRLAVAGMLVSIAVILWLPMGTTPQLWGIAGILVGMLYVLTRNSTRPQI